MALQPLRATHGQRLRIPAATDRKLRYASRLAGIVCGSLGLLVACTVTPQIDPCERIDPVLAASSFIVVVDPPGGVRRASPVQVRGCSRTNESNVVWELRGRNGRVLASGYTIGGGFSGAAPFEFAVHFDVREAELGHLEVLAPDQSDGEGFPPPRVVVPLLLTPGQP